MHENIQSLLPLTPTVFHMLLALADGEKHGYGIMRAVEEETEGQMQIRTGSLYGSIRRMIEAGLIEETNERPDPELDDERRAAMVSNLLVVLCSDRHTQPVVNTGTLYS